AFLVEALSLCEKKLGTHNLFTLVTLHSLANLYRVHQQYDLAEKHYGRALPLYEEIVKKTPGAQPTCVYHVALNLFGQKKFREAIATAQQSISMRAEREVNNPVEDADCYTLMARAEVDLGDDEQAIPLFIKALDIQNERLPNNHPVVLGLLGALSGCYMRLNRFHETEGYLEHLVEQIETSDRPDYELMVEALLDLGRVRTVQGKVVEAMPLYRRGLRFLQHQVGPNDRLLQKILEGFQSLLSLQKGEAEGVIDLLVLFRGEREQIRKLLEDRPGWADSRDRTGWGPLQWAIFMGREDIASWLLRKGASTEFDSEDALGPLHVAAAWGRRQALMDLLSSGCEVNARGPAGWTPLFWACHMGRGRIVELLLKRNVEVNLRDDLGWSPLHVAAAGGHADCAVALLSANARVNAKEKTRGQTPMHLAASRSHMKMVEVLMLNGGDVTLQDQEGKSAMDVAGERGNRLMVRFMNKFLTGRGKWEGTPNAD
ncbi:MAG: ankyrin repeat domain-containing protein, partial [Candidatus Eremiobacteraeota bacterium]|nr:ankyrin repeat domain-containing protein [Candidatus Eremiobacteraeota bacterium]